MTVVELEQTHGSRYRICAGIGHQSRPGDRIDHQSEVRISSAFRSRFVINRLWVISTRNLADKDALSLSDPMCVVWIRRGLQTEWTEVGRTEVIQNTVLIS